ncbi:MAG: 30S ribosomal protein S6 [Candidatus Hatepunaea meridiana]|nr:30S ribosomal protein S6 [Candidatus Hatepunaea meridiana]
MIKYELLYVSDPSNDDGIEDAKKKIEGIITGRAGSVISYDKLGKKRLAYPIQKRQYGFYFLVNFKGDGKIVQALDYFLRLNTVVIRHLIIQLTEKQLDLKKLTVKIQKEEAERMRRGGRPIPNNETTEEHNSNDVNEMSKTGIPVKTDDSEKAEIGKKLKIKPSSDYKTTKVTEQKDVEVTPDQSKIETDEKKNDTSESITEKVDSTSGVTEETSENNNGVKNG